MREGHTELALSLIRLGAFVNQEDRNGNLPIIYYVNEAKEHSDELFIRLIPENNINILKTICRVFHQTKSTQEVLPQMASPIDTAFDSN